MYVVIEMANGLVQLPWWGYALVVLALTHITIITVTVFLHRYQAHRALDLHPAVSHFFRFWLWLTTGMVTKEWAAVHRKHHARVETAEDPHSPVCQGLRKVLLEGAELYAKEADEPHTIARYGHGTPDDWIERVIYSEHQILGVALMLVIDLVLFGAIGLTLWAVQMAWIPFFAAGVINGLGHHSGYRSYATEDASVNIVPWGILIGGEELHNNHHAYGSSARFSTKWYELDIGWLYIRLLCSLRLAVVRRVAPRVRIDSAKAVCDLCTLQAVITHRYEVAARLTRTALVAAKRELDAMRVHGAGFNSAKVKLWLHRDARDLRADERAGLEAVLANSSVLRTIYSMQQELRGLWTPSITPTEQLLHQLEQWCQRAEQSGIAALRDFSFTLRAYTMPA